jgi:hypothetical protein
MTLTALLAVLAGLALLALVAFDALVSILHPAARGPLGHAVSRGAWRLTQRLAHGRRERRVLSFAGPLAIFGTLATWITLAWIAFGLIYLPFMPEGVSSPSGEATEGDVLEALYLSGTALSTLGFGDIVATQ